MYRAQACAGYATDNSTDDLVRLGSDSSQMLYLARAYRDDGCAVREIQDEEGLRHNEHDNESEDDGPDDEERSEEKGYGIVREERFRKLLSLCIVRGHEFTQFEPC